jgi:hypothetical protein
LRLRARSARRTRLDVLVLSPAARWTERGLRLRNAPRGGTLVGQVKRVPRGTFTVSLELDRLHARAGRKLNLALVARSRVTLASREAGSRGPRLLLRTAPTPAPIPTPTPTPTPVPDTTPPAVTVSNPGSTDGLPTFSGSTEPGAQVTLRVAQTAGAVQTFAATVGGDGSWSVRAPYLLAPGDYTVQAAARDAAGNGAATAATGFIVVPTVATAGDIGCDPAHNVPDAFHCQQQATSDLLIDRGYHRILALGDNQYDTGTLAAFNTVFDPSWGRVKPLISPIAGNHEYTDPAGGAQGYFDYFNGAGQATGPAGTRGEGWYDFTLGAWHIIALNSDCADVGGCDATSAQYAWLDGKLNASSAACTLVYWHHPRFSSGNGQDAPVMQPIWQDLVDRHADLVLNGHSHGYEQFNAMDGTGAPDASGVQEIVVGTGGEDFYPLTNATTGSSQVKIANTFGVLRLSLHPASYDWKFISIAGQTLTSGSRDCH